VDVDESFLGITTGSQVHSLLTPGQGQNPAQDEVFALGDIVRPAPDRFPTLEPGSDRLVQTDLPRDPMHARRCPE